jgi:hypothetical protein
MGLNGGTALSLLRRVLFPALGTVARSELLGVLAPGRADTCQLHLL